MKLALSQPKVGERLIALEEKKKQQHMDQLAASKGFPDEFLARGICRFHHRQPAKLQRDEENAEDRLHHGDDRLCYIPATFDPISW